MIPLFQLKRQHWRHLIMAVLALILTHLISYGKLPFDPGYKFPTLVFFVILVVGIVVCETNWLNYQRLNKKLEHTKNPLKKAMSQLLSNLLATAVVFTLVTLIANLLVYGHIPTVTRMLTFIFISLMISFGETLVFISQDFHKLYQKQKEKSLNSTVPIPWAISSGKTKIMLHAQEIAYLYSKTGMVSVVLNSGKRIVTNYSSLKQLETNFDTSQFFRINRQYMIRTSAIKTVVSDVNRKLKIELNPPVSNAEKYVVISRYKNSAFKEWMA